MQSFCKDILIHGRKEKIADYFNGTNYIQHGAGPGNGTEIFNRISDMMTAGNRPLKITKIHKVLGEGNFVLIVAEGEFNKKLAAPCPEDFGDLEHVISSTLKKTVLLQPFRIKQWFPESVPTF